jgi:tetratricopeptide (TPR) repeat protein
MRRKFAAAVASAAIMLWAVQSMGVLAAVSEPIKDPTIDSAPCFAAAVAAADPDQIITNCGLLIDSEKAPAADRLRAVLARAGAYLRKGQDDRAIADYDVALKLDPTLADIFNARGELWRKKGDRPRALADFGAAIKLNPQHAVARGNYRSLAQELERIGAQMAISNKPSFDCSTARRAVEKAICADPALARLDREIDGVHALVIREAGRGSRSARDLQRQQDAYLATRNASFGRPGYDLQKAMKARLQQLSGSDGY